MSGQLKHKVNAARKSKNLTIRPEDDLGARTVTTPSPSLNTGGLLMLSRGSAGYKTNHAFQILSAGNEIPDMALRVSRQCIAPNRQAHDNSQTA